jgi:chitosanase
LQKLTCLAIVNVFETGSPEGDYGAVTVLPGDPGHLTYGRSQTTLASGHLYLLIKAYVDDPEAEFATELRGYLERLAKRDVTLDTDASFRGLLYEAGEDPAMQVQQDDFFDRTYFRPALASAASVGLTLPLAIAVVYDSRIQGGWARNSQAVIAAAGRVSASCSEREWIGKYIAVRRAHLLSSKPPLPRTAYRMDTFASLIAANKWNLELPLTLESAIIDHDSFARGPVPVRASIPDPATSTRTILRRASPYMTGTDVQTVQEALESAGFANSKDGIYGPFTQALVSQFQAKAGLKPDGIVGPQTWTALLGLHH